MAKHTQETLRFHSVNGKTVRVDFNGGELSSDFGTLLLREIAIRSELIPRLVKAIQEKRHQSYIDHSIQDLLTQRVLQMACGYQDANNSNHLRKDPMFKLAVGRSPLNTATEPLIYRRIPPCMSRHPYLISGVIPCDLLSDHCIEICRAGASTLTSKVTVKPFFNVIQQTVRHEPSKTWNCVFAIAESINSGVRRGPFRVLIKNSHARRYKGSIL
ncbi:transposase [Endozoicomonas sp. ALD040]|uniref:transposase n=1 Tax=unclassified Endozoicomonas TaxID=2644528 RepID=UPI003BB0478F